MESLLKLIYHTNAMDRYESIHVCKSQCQKRPSTAGNQQSARSVCREDNRPWWSAIWGKEREREIDVGIIRVIF
jgi:hypothetical protein